MVVWIGQDCWDIINSFKEDLEEQDRHKERLTKCMKEMFYQKVNHFEIKKLFSKKRRGVYSSVRTLFIFFDVDFIKDICKEIRKRDHPLYKLFRNNRHYKVRIIILGDIKGVRDIPSCIKHNISVIDDSINFRRQFRERIRGNGTYNEAIDNIWGAYALNNIASYRFYLGADYLNRD